MPERTVPPGEKQAIEKELLWQQNCRLSQVWWVKCILRYIPPSEGVERTTKTQRTQRSIDPMSIKLITQNLEEPIVFNQLSVISHHLLFISQIQVIFFPFPLTTAQL
ncbi:hypothetical protein MTo_01408 [Microcystis aeruginosa NIES-1211]|uniref:hypothetical protein n=1 Tax=Microcystis TaxID=1125 RepID=UPI000D9AC6C3|nr:hypothetical protein [Microcystis aeruginosa]GBL14113.1 hypothetical protein MTo_01408 [Microcystis aeruginosa NIES-1211]GCA83298.1 hypothetical protein MiHa_01259 [Microcystis aeruginosa NIES-2522]